jgi:hypothetical protein
MADISTDERKRIAALAGINEQYLYQCLTQRADMEPAKAVDVERLSKKLIRRWHLRRDWPRVWPELKRAKGAPKVCE